MVDSDLNASIGKGTGGAIPASTRGAVTIPSTLGGRKVTSIGERAFCDYTGLTSVSIPSSVTSIGDKAFYGCSGLASWTIPSSVTSIGERAFYKCGGLTSVTISSSVTSIGVGAFDGCSGMTSVYFEGAPPSGVSGASIGQDAAIRYNAAYGDEWLPVIEQCGWTNASRMYLIQKSQR